MRSDGSRGSPKRALTAAAAAAAEAAEEPRPEPKGSPLWRERDSPTDLILSFLIVVMAAIPAQLKLRFLVSFGAPVMEEIEIVPGSTSWSTETVTVSPRVSTAHPRKSKPGPRFATVAGAKAVMVLN